MGKTLLNTDIKRERGKLYYCATNDKGNIVVCEVAMKNSSKKKKEAKK